MQKLFLSEYVSEIQNRTATVSKVMDQNCFVVDCYENATVVASEIYPRERMAEIHADQWCKDNPSDSGL